MKAVGLTLLLLLASCQFHMDQCFRYPSPIIHDYVRTFKRVAVDTYQPPPTTTTATPKPMSKNIENLIMYQKAFTAVIKDVRKHFDKAEDLAKIDSILQDLEITRLVI